MLECWAWMTEPDILYKYLLYLLSFCLISICPIKNGPPTSNIPQLAQAHVAPLLANGNNNVSSTGPKKYGSRIDCPRCGKDNIARSSLTLECWHSLEQAKWFSWPRRWWAVVRVGTRVASLACRATRDWSRHPCASAKEKSTAKVCHFVKCFINQMNLNNFFFFKKVATDDSLDRKDTGSDKVPESYKCLNRCLLCWSACR